VELDKLLPIQAGVPASWSFNLRYKTAAMVSAQRLLGTMELRMRYRLPTVTAALMCVVCSSAAFASPYDWSYQGQYPLPPSLSNRTAQPECGFAATENWGPNGFQWCDSKNMYPRPRLYRFHPK
jgi:hypothetical protein